MEIYRVKSQQVEWSLVSRVDIVRTVPEYPSPPFSPNIRYPEYLFDDFSVQNNYVYDGVRELLIHLRLDERNLGKKAWNPLSFIKPGDTVAVKPNLVSSRHFRSGNILSVITHASVLRPLVDFALIALKGKGKVIIADSPERMTDFDLILEKSGIRELAEYYDKHDIDIPVIDLRLERIKYGLGAIVRREDLLGDPEGYSLVNLGVDSCFDELSGKKLGRLYGADYNRRVTLRHHSRGKHEYEMANTILKSDVVISVPKLKTHKKAGISLNMKGFIGCAGNKNLVPHRTLGDPSNGGDSYPGPPVTKRGLIVRRVQDLLQDNLLGVTESKPSAILYTLILRAFKLLLRPPRDDLKYGGGQWHGNDTLWRGIVDLARIVYYADKAGKMRDKTQRKFLSVIDGIYGADREGPIEPRLRKEGVLLGGLNPVELDVVGAQLMGFDYRKINQIQKALEKHRYDLSLNVDDVEIVSDEKKFETLFKLKRNETLAFEPAEQWRGKIELEEQVR